MGPSVVQGLVVIIEFIAFPSCPVQLFFKCSDFQVGQLKLSVQVLNFFLVVPNRFQMLSDGVLCNNNVLFLIVEFRQCLFQLLFDIGELIFKFSDKVLILIDQFVLVLDEFLQSVLLFVPLFSLGLNLLLEEVNLLLLFVELLLEFVGIVALGLE